LNQIEKRGSPELAKDIRSLDDFNFYFPPSFRFLTPLVGSFSLKLHVCGCAQDLESRVVCRAELMRWIMLYVCIAHDAEVEVGACGAYEAGANDCMVTVVTDVAPVHYVAVEGHKAMMWEMRFAFHGCGVGETRWAKVEVCEGGR
jgi:hypothetical protein